MRTLTAVLLPIRIILTIILVPFVQIFYLSTILIIGIPSHLLRKLIGFIGRCLDKDLAKPVTAMASISARDFTMWYTSPAQSVSTIIKIKGHITVETLQQLVIKKLINGKNSTGDELEYPEFQQYCASRLGYLFYKWDRNFNIGNHVKLYQSNDLLPNPGKDTVDDKKLMEILEELMIRPYIPKQSPWEIFLLPNYIPSKCNDTKKLEKSEVVNENDDVYTALVLRNEHSLMDGYATYRILLTLTDHGLEMWEKEMASRQPPKYFTFFLHLKAILFGPTTFVWKLVKGLDMPCHALHRPKKQLSGKSYCAITTLKLEQVKKVRKIHSGISFHSVLLAGIAGGIRNYMIDNGLKIPYNPVRLGIPIPMPGHSNKLRNEYLSSIVELPVHKRTATERLFDCERKLNEIKFGAFTPFLSQAMLIIGGFPVDWIRKLTETAGVTVMYSAMKGPAIPLTVLNQELQLADLMYVLPLGSDDLGITFSSLSYDDRIHFAISVDTAVIKSREKVDEFLHYIEKEIEDFQCGDFNNV